MSGFRNKGGYNVSCRMIRGPWCTCLCEMRIACLPSATAAPQWTDHVELTNGNKTIASHVNITSFLTIGKPTKKKKKTKRYPRICALRGPDKTPDDTPPHHHSTCKAHPSPTRVSITLGATPHGHHQTHKHTLRATHSSLPPCMYLSLPTPNPGY
jgi:hypothetical protein